MTKDILLLGAFYLVMAGTIIFAIVRGDRTERSSAILLTTLLALQLGLGAFFEARYDAVDPGRAIRRCPRVCRFLLDRDTLSEVLAITRSSPTIVEPGQSFSPNARPRRRSIGLWLDEECAHFLRAYRAARRHRELPAAAAPCEIAALVPGLTWPRDRWDLGLAVARLAGEPREHVVYTLHDAAGKFLHAATRKGEREGIALDYRELIESAFAHRASGLLLVHNHPSGDPTPSADDIAATRMLAALCNPLSLILHDHLIVGSGSLLSMRRAGYFNVNRGEPARSSTSWEPGECNPMKPDQIAPHQGTDMSSLGLRPTFKGRTNMECAR